MGLTGFYKLLTKKCNYKPTQVAIRDLVGKTIAIDGDAAMYRAMHGCTSGTEVRPSDVAIPILKWMTTARDIGIETIFVVSAGPPPIEKLTHCSVRRKRKRTLNEESIRDMEKKLQEEGTDPAEEVCVREKILKLRSSNRQVTSSVSSSVVDLLEENAFKCIRAKSEADFMLVQLSEDDKCDFIATDDADIIVSGGNAILRGFFRMLSNNDIYGSVFVRSEILHAMGMTSDQLLQLGTILSCDYQPPIPKVGPVTALRAIKEHGTVETFLSAKRRKQIHLPQNMSVESYVRLCNRSIEIFKSRPDR